MITLKTPISEFVALISKSDACGEGIEWATTMMKQLGEKITMAEAFEIVAKEYQKENTTGIQWITWILKTFYKEMDAELREVYANKIEDPMTAAQLVIKNADLTEKEVAILDAKYIGILPTVTKEIQEGTITKASAVAVKP